MEQRNGRIDRHGQKAPEVFIHHFVYANNEDFDFLDEVVNKVQTMREDIGSVGEIIARQVEEVMLGLEENRQLDVSDKQKIREKVREEIKADVITKNRVQELSQKLSLAQREWRLYPENLKLVLDEALKLQGHKGLEPITMGKLTGRGFHLRTPLPVGWKDCSSL